MDNSGTIDYGEFIAATVHLNKLEREEHLIAAFQYFDKDGSGYITVDELQQACAEHNMTDVFLEDIIREVDQDNVSHISLMLSFISCRVLMQFNILYTFNLNYASPLSRHQISMFFCLQDGRIDYGEFVAMMQKGNAGIGRRTMRNSLNMSMRDAPGAH